MDDVTAKIDPALLLESAANNLAALSKDKLIVDTVKEVSDLITNRLRLGATIFFAGNGGSAADAQHMAGEFISRFMFDRAPLAAVSLTTDTSVLTAIGNDYGYDQVFSRQLKGLAKANDIFVAYSTSGNSENIINALGVARAESVTTIGMTGNRGGRMNELCDYLVCIPNASTPRIQEGHLVVGHAICELVEHIMFKQSAYS